LGCQACRHLGKLYVYIAVELLSTTYNMQALYSNLMIKNSRDLKHEVFCVIHVILVLCYCYVACCFNSFSLIFAISWIIAFSKMTRDMLFQCFVQRLCSVDEHVVLLEETQLEIQNFKYNCFELADMDNSEGKVNFILKTWSARISWCSASPWKKITTMYISTIKEELTSHLILIWLFCMTRVFDCLLHTLSFCVHLTKENYTFLDQWNWIVDCPVNSRKLQKYFQQYI